MAHIMLDLETLGNNSNSVIIAVGAVKFNNDGSIVEEFYRDVDAQSCIDIGLEMDASTVYWWMQQSDKAREVFKRDGDPIKEVLKEFSEVVEEDDKIWGNGVGFDNTILSNSYKACGLEVPWKFWNDKCYRTLKGLYRDVELKRSGTHHNALDDAFSQTWHLLDIVKKHNLDLEG